MISDVAPTPQLTEAIPAVASQADHDIAVLRRSLGAASRHETPFAHWLLDGVLDPELTRSLTRRDVLPPRLDGVSGSRDVHNDQRSYLDPAAIRRSATCRRTAELFQSRTTVALLETATGARLAGTYLRVEYAQDVDGFWLQPHTDLGVKRLSLLIYLAKRGQADHGTDLYWSPGAWAGRAPFAEGNALMFIPSDCSWHGFEPRPINGVRRSLIVNYVSEEWRSREQLAYPERPVEA
jgi:hypothetical protein